MKNFIEIRLKSCMMVLFVFCVAFASLGQKNKNANQLESELYKVGRLLSSKQFGQAVATTQRLAETYPKSEDVYLMMGLAYINMPNRADSAVVALSKAMDLMDRENAATETGINIQMSLAKAYQLKLQPQRSIDLYNSLKTIIPADSLELVKEIAFEMQACENAKLFISNPIALKITNLGQVVNTKYDEHTPLVSYNGQNLFFTSRQQQAGLPLLDDGQYPEKVFSATKQGSEWSPGKNLQSFYRRSDHESAVSISADGKQMFLFKSDPDGKNLYTSTLKNGTWGTPVKLPEPINSYSHETHCSLSADGSTLFFTSDREGGFGGLDIYMCKKLPDGTWGNARNLGSSINTPLNEETPMIFMDGKTLYFASEGHTSMGMFDMFYSYMQPDSSWIEPVNLGYPINSPTDDLFFVPTIERSQAYYSTSQFDENLGGMDIYLIEFDPHFKGKLAVVEGKVEQAGNLKTIRILVSRADDNELVGDYRPDPVTGDYLMFLETGQRYAIKEVRQLTIEEVVGEIFVSDELAFSSLQSSTKLKDVEIQLPLVPFAPQVAINTTTTAPLQVVLQNATTPSAGSSVVNTSNTSTRSPESNMTPIPAIGLTANRELPYRAHVDSAFTIQVLALKTKRLRNLNYFSGLDLSRISEHKCNDGFYRYTYAVFDTKEASLAARLAIIDNTKFKDAFVRSVNQLAELRVAEP